MLSDKEKLRRLKEFGIWISDKTNTINLANDIYTEGGKNKEVHRTTDNLNRKLKQALKKKK